MVFLARCTGLAALGGRLPPPPGTMLLPPPMGPPPGTLPPPGFPPPGFPPPGEVFSAVEARRNSPQCGLLHKQAKTCAARHATPARRAAAARVSASRIFSAS